MKYESQVVKSNPAKNITILNHAKIQYNGKYLEDNVKKEIFWDEANF